MARLPRRVVLTVCGLLVLVAAASGGAVSDQVRDEAAYFALGAADGNVGLVLVDAEAAGVQSADALLAGGLGAAGGSVGNAGAPVTFEVGDSDALRARRHVQWRGAPAAYFDMGLVAVARTAKDITQAPPMVDLSAADPGLAVGLRLDCGGPAIRSLLGTVDQGSQGEGPLGCLAEDLLVQSNAQWGMRNPQWDGWGQGSGEVPSSEFRVPSSEGGPKAEIPKGGNQGPGTGDGASRANPKSEIRNPKLPGGTSPGRGAGVVTPAPATLGLLALGGLGLVIRRRR